MMLARIKSWTRLLKRDGVALVLAVRDPRTPWYAKALPLAMAIYTISPFDLIPDVIPLLGLIDEAILLPVALRLALRLVPSDVLADSRARAGRSGRLSKILAWSVAAFVALWLALAILVAWLIVA